MLLQSAFAGYITGSVLALGLDNCYTGAPLTNPIARYGGRACFGTAGYVLARVEGPPTARLPGRFCYLPLWGAVAGLLIARRAVDARHAALLALFAAALGVLAAADFERHLLPNRVMYPALAAAVLLGWAWPARPWLSTMEGGGMALLVMLAFFLIFPKLGFGDVKLSALLGLVAGASHALPALALGIIAGGIGAVVLFVTHRAGRGSLIAYGPYLALGAFAGMLMR